MPKKLAELPGAAEGPVAAGDGWLELAVANPTFLLERLGSECTDLQGLRELTVNGLDAIAALGADRRGRVVCDPPLSPSPFTAALLPRQLLHATLQKRLGQKLGAARREQTRPSSDATVAPRDRARSRGYDHTAENDHEREEQTG